MWTNGKRCAVALSFDFDAESLWATLKVSSPTFMSRGNYGAKVGVPRILQLLEKYHIHATFFVPADTARRHPEAVKEIHARGHEIGHHGDLHESPANLQPAEEKRALEVGLDTLEKLVGERPRGYRSPAWDLSHNSARFLEEYGFLYDSSLMGDDFHLYQLKDGERETTVVELPVAWELDDAPHFLFNFFPTYLVGLSAPSKVYEIWASEFDGAYLHNGVYVLTMHPQIIGRWHRMVMLEKLIQYIAGHTEVWFATCSEIVTEWKRQQGGNR
jgi:peptidoglycan/xylan/chitin deacetylase (PgdA/CDA1 family)